MLEAINDIDSIIKAVAMYKLTNDGHIDGRVARGIANEIVKQSGVRFLETKKKLSEKEGLLAEKEEQLGKGCRGHIREGQTHRGSGERAIRGDTQGHRAFRSGRGRRDRDEG